MVRIHAGQPFDARCDAPLAHGLRPGYTGVVNALVAEARRMALSEGRRTESKGNGVLYVLRLRSGALYIGATQELEQRLDDHVTGHGGRTTRLDPPVALLRIETYPTFAAARQREAQLKRWSRAKKEALAAGDVARLTALSATRGRGGRARL